MNQKGYSWMESILTIAVLSVIFSTLLPVATKIMLQVQQKKQSMHASQTLYYGTIAYHSYEQTAGNRKIDGENYYWSIQGNGICVSYDVKQKEFSKCIDYSS